MPEFQVASLDIAILLAYVLGTRLVLGWYSPRRARGGGAAGYFLAGRSMRWPVIGLSFYVANMSGATFVALPASGFHQGIAVYHYEWLPALILVGFVLIFLPLYLRTRVFTAPQFLEVRFGEGARLTFAGFLLVANIFIDAAAALYAGATIASVLFPDLPLWQVIAAAAFLAGAYIVAGSLRAAVLNDALQAGLILLGGAFLAILTWPGDPLLAGRDGVGGGPAPHAPRRRPGHALAGDPQRRAGDRHLLLVHQPVRHPARPGGRSLDHARWGALFAGLLKLPNLFLLILPGVMATALYPGLEDPDRVFPTLAFDLLPVGLRGLMLAALAAAILSSLEAILNSAATLFTMDFVARLRPGTSETALVRIGRAATVAFMALSAAWAPHIARFPTLWQYLQSVLAYATPPVVAVLLLGLLWPRANRAGAVATLALGVPLGLAAWAANEVLKLSAIPYLYASGLLLAASAAVLTAVALATGPPTAEQAANTWTPALWRAETAALAGHSWYANPRYQSLGLVALSASVVVWWW